ncbi:MAG: FAD-binding protein [Lachnospiraceae bacterium]|nr:FAD-binding protein [Lachnospiraceae bacterium]
MRKKKWFSLMLAGVLAFSMCPASQASEEAETEGNSQAAGYSAGTFTGEGQGFGGTVTVTITTDENGILDVSAEGPDETPDVGGAALDELAAQVLEAQSSDIDGVSGASFTSAGIRTAAQAAIDAAQGVDATETEKAVVADGTYTSKTPSFGVMGEMELSVTFENNQITDITTICAGSATQADEDEYSAIYATVEENLYPRIIESQSLAVDSISGATVSSNAAKTIIADIIDENGGDSSQWYTAIEKSTDVVVLEDYDVIVVGLGASGLASYLSAAENGATVFGIETAAKIGGNGTNTAGPLGVNPEKQVENNGGELFVDTDELLEAWMEYTEGDAKEELVELFIEESGETFGWLEDNYDFAFLPDMYAFYDSHGWQLWTMYYDSTMTSKDIAYNNSIETAKAMNEKNDYMTELTATDLLLDEDGTVIGVEAEYYDGTIYQIYGDSVILATGGYIGNSEMCLEYTGSTWHTKGMTPCDGFAISEALELGGALYNEDVAVEDHIAQLDTIIRSDDYSYDDKSLLTSLVLDLNYQMIDSNGDSFDGNYNGLGLAFNAWEAGSNYYVLINEEEYESIKTNGLISFNEPMFFFQGGTYEEGTPVENLDEIMAMGQEYNDVIIADSLEALEEQLGFTINLDDVHGQTEGKIYCIIGAAYVYSTCGGMDVDVNMNLLKEDGTAIENVYVVGNDSLGVLNASDKAYVTYGGCAQGWALTSGRLAGANAAAKYAG